MLIWELKLVAKGNLSKSQCYKDTLALYEKWQQIIENLLHNVGALALFFMACSDDIPIVEKPIRTMEYRLGQW